MSENTLPTSPPPPLEPEEEWEPLPFEDHPEEDK